MAEETKYLLFGIWCVVFGLSWLVYFWRISRKVELLPGQLNYKVGGFIGLIISFAITGFCFYVSFVQIPAKEKAQLGQVEILKK